MNPIHQCFQKISPGNHFSYVRDVRTYVRTYVRTDVQTRVMLYAPPHYKWRGHKNMAAIIGGNMKAEPKKHLWQFLDGKLTVLYIVWDSE